MLVIADFLETLVPENYFQLALVFLQASVDDVQIAFGHRFLLVVAKGSSYLSESMKSNARTL